MADSEKPSLPENTKAQEFLDGFVMQEILVVLIHMPTRQSISKHLALKNVRGWCEQSIDSFPKKAPAGEFIVVEIRKNGVVRTTSLDSWDEPSVEIE